MVKYEGGGVYRCKVWDSDEVIQSRDVIFKEGDGHWVTTAEEEDGEDDVPLVNSAAATPDTATDMRPGTLMIQNSSAGKNGLPSVSEFGNGPESSRLPQPSTSTPAQTNPPPAPRCHCHTAAEIYGTEPT
ncbi:hypothetical protein L218DRAFT_586979 [Marasmius fiardii PR-910]|nr:hypothetical protein L218DRAFT_586979 [Marasmius fiardii PR-910]